MLSSALSVTPMVAPSVAPVSADVWSGVMTLPSLDAGSAVVTAPIDNVVSAVGGAFIDPSSLIGTAFNIGSAIFVVGLFVEWIKRGFKLAFGG